MQKLAALLREKNYLHDPRVEAAFLKTDRSHYCPPNTDHYNDGPVQIGFNATISAPHMHIKALEVLKDKLVDGAKVLDVGSGSGYLTACMARLVGPTGTVYGVDHISDLVDLSISNIKKDCPELLDQKRIHITRADGRVGLEQFAPYDAIHVGATASSMPEKLLEQLKVGGRMVLPVQREHAQVFECVDKLSDGEYKTTPLLNVRYVPLTDVVSQLCPAPEE